MQAERTTVLDYCNALTDAEWSAPSAASGWTVQDVVAHLGATARAPFTPELITLLRTKEIERTNDVGVASGTTRLRPKRWPSSRPGVPG